MAYSKVTRDQIAHYLNVGTSSTPDWAIIGVGVTDYSLSYNPQTTTEKWIINKNATTSLDSYQIAGDVTQQCYFGDEVYDYVNNLRRNASVGSANETEIIDIDLYDYTSATTSYKATKYNCTIAVNSYGGGENAQIEYTISYNGNPTLGRATFTGGVPTFTPETTSL